MEKLTKSELDLITDFKLTREPILSQYCPELGHNPAPPDQTLLDAAKRWDADGRPTMEKPIPPERLTKQDWDELHARYMEYVYARKGAEHLVLPFEQWLFARPTNWRARQAVKELKASAIKDAKDKKNP